MSRTGTGQGVLGGHGGVRRLGVALAMGALLLGLGGCGDDDDPSAPETYIVSGTVYYSQTPLDGVTVELLQGSVGGTPLQTVVTDGGDFIFRGVPDFAGTSYVKAYAPSAEFLGWVARGMTVTDDAVVDIYLPKISPLISPANGSTVATTHPTLNWTTNPEASSYRVQVNVSAGWELVEFNPCSGPPYTIVATLAHGVNYTWQVTAYDAQMHEVATCFEDFNFTVQ